MLWGLSGSQLIPCALSSSQNMIFCTSSRVCIAFPSFGMQFLFFQVVQIPSGVTAGCAPCPTRWVTFPGVMFLLSNLQHGSSQCWVWCCRYPRQLDFHKIIGCSDAEVNLQTAVRSPSCCFLPPDRVWEPPVNCTGVMGEGSTKSHGRAKRRS